VKIFAFFFINAKLIVTACVFQQIQNITLLADLPLTPQKITSSNKKSHKSDITFGSVVFWCTLQ